MCFSKSFVSSYLPFTYTTVSHLLHFSHSYKHIQTFCIQTVYKTCYLSVRINTFIYLFASHPWFHLQNPDHFLLSVLSSAFHFQLPQLVNVIKILTIKKGLNSMFPLKRSRELSFHPMTPLNTVKPPLMHSQPPWQICIHYFHFLTFVICQFTAIWLWFPLLQ